MNESLVCHLENLFASRFNRIISSGNSCSTIEMKNWKNIKKQRQKIWIKGKENSYFVMVFCFKLFSLSSKKKLLAWNENWEWKNDERALSEKVKHQRTDWDNKVRELKIDISYLKWRIKAIKNEIAMKILISSYLIRITLFRTKIPSFILCHPVAALRHPAFFYDYKREWKKVQKP